MTLFLVPLVLHAVGCSGELVLLNERAFTAPAGYEPGSSAADAAVSDDALIALPLAGCTAYHLGDGSKESMSESGFGVVISQRSEDTAVVVDVDRAGQTLVERRYDESFFASGAVDEFAVPAASGDELVFRTWGSVDPVGAPDCPPLSDEGP